VSEQESSGSQAAAPLLATPLLAPSNASCAVPCAASDCPAGARNHAYFYCPVAHAHVEMAGVLAATSTDGGGSWLVSHVRGLGYRHTTTTPLTQTATAQRPATATPA
jgi:hypothetical protein